MAEIINNRFIRIDDDTLIGYYYPNQKFFVTNKNTTTTRNTAEQILKVMLVLLGKVEIETPKGNIDLTDLDNPKKLEINARKLEQLIKNTTETLGTPITCTLEDNGSYIKTLQFNEWTNYPLEVDCEKGNIFIKNTNIVYPLDLNESPDARVARFCSYYLETLGLGISEDIMLKAYSLLANQYNEPSFYNVLSNSSENLIYSNTFKLNNYTDTSAINCEGVRNPENQLYGKYLVNLESTDSEQDVILFQSPVNPDDFKDLYVGSKIQVQGTQLEVNGTLTNSDGDYTISQFVNSSLGDRDWSCVTYGNGKFVALSKDGFMTESLDGTWSAPIQVESFKGFEWSAIAYGNNKFIALSRYGYMSEYPHLDSERHLVQSWGTPQPITVLSNQEWVGLTYAGNKFVALSYTGYMSIYSEQNEEWSWSQPEYLASSGLDDKFKERWSGIAYYSNKLVILHESGYYSDGTAPESFNAPKSFRSNTSNSWKCLVGDSYDLVALSSDGCTTKAEYESEEIHWTSVKSIANLGDNKWTGIATDNSKFIALSSTGYLSTKEGNNWLKATTKRDDTISGLQLLEPLTSSYQYPYPTCYVQSVDCEIRSMEQENNVITIELGQLPKNLLIGDTIQVEGATQTLYQEIVSCDGAYTVKDIAAQVKEITDTVLRMGPVTYNDDKVYEIKLDTLDTELSVGDVISVTGTSSQDDKNYTITNVSIPIPSEEGGAIPEGSRVVLQVKEEIPYTYGSTEPKSVSGVVFKQTTSLNTIDLPANFDRVINKGDFITVEASNKSIQYEVTNKVVLENNTTVISVDSSVSTFVGSETVDITVFNMSTVKSSCKKDLYYKIYVEEDIPADYISPAENPATFYKEVFVGNIIKITSYLGNSNITFDNISEGIKLEDGPNNSILYIYILGVKYISKVISTDNISSDNMVLIEPVDPSNPSPATPYIGQMPERGFVNLLIPREEILLDVTSVHDYLADVIPTGEFMVDSFAQCQAYIQSIRNLDTEISAKESKVPELLPKIDEKMYSELKENDEVTDIEDIKVTFKGLYSEVYPNL